MDQNKKTIPIWKYFILLIVIISVVAVALMAFAIYVHASNLWIIATGVIGIILLKLIFKYIIK